EVAAPGRSPAPPRPGDWLAEHDEPGQAFAESLEARPVRSAQQAGGRTVCRALLTAVNLPDAGADRDSPVLKTENWLRGVPGCPLGRAGVPVRAAYPPVTLSSLDRRGSVLGFCVTAVPQRPNRLFRGPVLPGCRPAVRP